MQPAIDHSGFNDAGHGWFSIYDQITRAGKVAHVTGYCRHGKGANRRRSHAFTGLSASKRRVYTRTTAARYYAPDQHADPYTGFDHLKGRPLCVKFYSWKTTK